MILTVWNWLKANVLQVVSSALFGLVVVLMVQIYGLPIIGGGLKSDLAKAKDALARVKVAQEKATTDQVAVNLEPARKSAEIARISDATSPLYYDSVRRASAERVRPAPQCATGLADLPGADRATPVDDGTIDAAGMVSVAEEDWASITAAAARAAQMHADAQALIDAGVAIASVDGEK